jgi:hypothetical protein
MSRRTFYAWSLVGAPLIGASVAIAFSDSHHLSLFVFLFVVLPPSLALSAAVLGRMRGGHAFLGTVGAALVGPALWFLLILWVVSEGLTE